MKTFSAKSHEVKRDWFVVDGTDLVLGRLASAIAHRLRGKHKAIYTPHVDTGDYIVVINAEKIKVTGNKGDDKVYHRHSGYPGGITSIVYSDLIEENPTHLIEKAIVGMLPKNKIGRAQSTKLKVYAGSEHPHAAQNPTKFEINQVSQIVKK